MMDWNRPERISTIVLDNIFDSAKGWDFTNDEVPLKKGYTDGNPYYSVTVDTISIAVFEQSKWKEGIVSTVSAGRLVARTKFIGIVLKDPTALLRADKETCGLPSFALDEENNIYMQISFPIASGFPVDLARKQLMVSLGLIAQEAKNYLRLWTKKKTNSDFDWETAKNVAFVTGRFLSAFLGGK